MRQILSWCVGILLCFFLLIAAPITLLSVFDEIEARRQIDNEIVMFIDEVRDSGTMTQAMEDDLYLAVNSYGPTMNIKIQKYTRMVNPNPDKPGSTYVSYVANEDTHNYEHGDRIVVSGTVIGKTSGLKFLESFLKMILPAYEPNYAARIR